MKPVYILISIVVAIGSPFIAFSQKVPASNAKASAPLPDGKGKAKVPPASAQEKPKTPPADDAIPKPVNFDRYSAMIDRSPFAVATAPTEVAGPPPWSKDLFIANAAHTPDVDLVTISSVSDKSLKEYVTTEKPNDHGYGIANIEWADNPGGTKVTISKDGQLATIGFNESVMSQPVPGQQPAGVQPAFPGGMKQPPPGVQQPGAAQPGLPAPHVRGPIQRSTRPASGITQPPPVPAQPNMAPASAPVEPPEN